MTSVMIVCTCDGKYTSKRAQKIPEDRFYDDSINLMYNFRAQVYGPVKANLQQTIPPMPLCRTIEVGSLEVKKVLKTSRSMASRTGKSCGRGARKSIGPGCSATPGRKSANRNNHFFLPHQPFQTLHPGA